MKYAKIAGFGLVLLILAGLLSISIKRECERAGDWAYWSCLLDVENAIRSAGPEEVLGITSVDGRWHILSDEEYEALLPRILRIAGDRHMVKAERLTDRWGHRPEIAFRRAPSGEYELLVWSKGPDGILRTDDDIVSQRERKLPREGDL